VERGKGTGENRQPELLLLLQRLVQQLLLLLLQRLVQLLLLLHELLVVAALLQRLRKGRSKRYPTYRKVRL
jgi:hypothetical protein